MQVSQLGGRPRQTGQMQLSIVVRNGPDVGRAQLGEIPATAVRQVDAHNVLVDTGALVLCLPANMIAALGLPFERVVHTETATGPGTARLFSQAQLEVRGRRGIFECLETPEGTLPLLGAVPMEMLGIEPDLKNRTIRLLPDEPGNTYFLIY